MPRQLTPLLLLRACVRVRARVCDKQTGDKHRLLDVELQRFVRQYCKKTRGFLPAPLKHSVSYESRDQALLPATPPPKNRQMSLLPPSVTSTSMFDSAFEAASRENIYTQARRESSADTHARAKRGLSVVSERSHIYADTGLDPRISLAAAPPLWDRLADVMKLGANAEKHALNEALNEADEDGIGAHPWTLADGADGARNDDADTINPGGAEQASTTCSTGRPPHIYCTWTSRRMLVAFLVSLIIPDYVCASFVSAV